MRRELLIAAASAGLAVAWCGAAAGAEAVTVYEVRKGDTLYDLAQRYFVRVGDYGVVQRRNKVADPRRLPVGARLTVPIRLLRTEPTEARLGAFRGDVRIEAGGRTIAPTKAMLLPEGAVISTGADAFARLDLEDGSRVTLPSQSRIRLDRLRRTLLTGAVDRELSVQAGRSRSKVMPLTSPQDRYIVRTPMSVSAVRGTEFRVWYQPDERRASTEVVEGSVTMDTEASEPTVIAAAQGATAAADGRLTARPLPPPPRLAAPGRSQDDPVVAFPITPAADAVAYRAEIAADAGFLDVVAETQSNAPLVAFNALPDGDYFLRTTTVDAGGLESVPAAYAFERALNTLDLQAPQASGEKRRRQYLFRWTVSGAGERVYRFQLVREGDPVPVIDEIGLTEPQITVTDLPAGAYSWRVMSRTFARGRFVEKWAPAQKFETGG
ncbi:FecR domain-containing protein [Caulobacter mirabilis]|uniref:Peptigoglycan-binding protein LysM n=1 Tax=Caulobacter mirabilis TaxID=69666 RepID=A0A2D2AZA2_9CAUL|nr:FecR domain-containing protein [Caulobacter mirabilis]ATQ43311.1 peptigoglycan-binding protein LysM [Caulobacter mirabilis]